MRLILKLNLLIVLSALLLTACERNDLYEIVSKKQYNLRDRGPAGGWIFHIVDHGNGTKTYYEAAPADAPGGLAYQWLSSNTWLNGSSVAEGETLTAIGTGKNNTAKILQYKNIRLAPAAEYCNGLTINNFNDWFLPSRDEFNLMYDILYMHGVGDFEDSSPTFYYWNSSEEDDLHALVRRFYVGGLQTISHKNNQLFVRAVRSFTQ